MANKKVFVKHSDLKDLQEKGYTQYQLAEKYGISVGTIRNILKQGEDREVQPRERRKPVEHGQEQAARGSNARMPHTLRNFLKEARRQLQEFGISEISLDVETGDCAFKRTEETRLGG